MFAPGNPPHNKGKTGLKRRSTPKNAGWYKKSHTPWLKGLVFENAVSPDEDNSKTYI